LARALPQASLAGVPTVTYDIDGAKEGAVDGKTGFVLPAFDKLKLSDAIGILLKDPARRREMGVSGREFALRRFDAKVMVDALERVYVDALRCAKQ
jgi:glycosyltransferase involved in cell wall biosynthesis